MASGLTRRAVRAGFSLAAMTVVENLAILARTLILARFVSPHEFGLMGIAFVAINAAETISQTGFAPAVVQRRDDPEPYLDTIWCVGAVRGLLLSGLVYLTAPWLGAFFRTPEAVPVLRAVGMISIIRGVMNPAWFLLERELKLARMLLPRVGGVVTDLIVSAVLGFLWRDVWAMVYGCVSGTLITLVLTYMVRPRWPRPSFDFGHFRTLRSYGKHVFRGEILTWLIQQGDKAVVGRLRDAASLGLYSFAWRLATLPAQTVGNILLRTTFPSFAAIQGQPERVRSAFARLLALVAAASFPLAAGLSVAASEIVRVLFGARWTPMTVTFQILCGLCASMALEITCGAVGSGLGRPDLTVRASLLRLCVMGLLIVPLTGLYANEGAALAVVLGSAAAACYLLAKVSSLVGVGRTSLLDAFLPPALGCLGMILAIGTLSWATVPAHGPTALAQMALAGVATYVATVLVADRLMSTGLATGLLSVLRSR